MEILILSEEDFLSDAERWQRELDALQELNAELVQAITGGTIEAANLTAPLLSPSYLEKSFELPEFICNDGQADLQLVNADILKQPTRLEHLLDNPLPDLPSDTTAPAPLGDEIEAKKAELKAEVDPAGSVVSMVHSAVMPLVSDVWNAVEPLNYVGHVLDPVNGILFCSKLCLACTNPSWNKPTAILRGP